MATGFMEETLEPQRHQPDHHARCGEAEYVAGLGAVGAGQVDARPSARPSAWPRFGFYSFGLAEVGWDAGADTSPCCCRWASAMALVNIGLMLRFGPTRRDLHVGHELPAARPVRRVQPDLGPARADRNRWPRCLPTTYAFGACPDVLDGGAMPWDDLGPAVVGAGGRRRPRRPSSWSGCWPTFKRRGFVTRYS